MEEICVKIIDGLYLGNYKTSMSKTTLTNKNISHILCVGHEMAKFVDDNYQYMKLEVEDDEDEDILTNFDDTFNFIEEGINKGGVLVHCFGGISRSSTIIIAYLIKKNKMSYLQAYEIVKTLKSDIKPNEGFVEKLKIFDKVTNRTVEFIYKCK